MKIAICDDDALQRRYTVQMLEEYIQRKNLHDVRVTEFTTGWELLDAARGCGGFEIYILDIIMAEINGIALGMKLREAGFDGKIIYLTSSMEYAVDSYRVKAFQYLLKPVEPAVLVAVMDEAMESLAQRGEESLMVKTRDRIVRLNYGSILYAERNKRSVVYHLTNGTEIESLSIRTTFSEAVQPLLQDRRFVLCGASQVVNMEQITAIENEALVFKNVYRVYWSVKSCRELRSAWYNYWFDKEENR